MPDEKKKASERILERIDELDAKKTEEAEAIRDTLKTELDSQAERLNAVEARLTTRRGPENSEEERPKPISINRLFAGLRAAKEMGNAGWTEAKAEYERDVCLEGKRTAQAYTQDTLGGYIVPEQYMPERFQELLRAKVIAFQLGVQQLNGLVGSPIRIPRQTAAATAYWTAENTAITESNITVGDMSMEPHKLSALVKTSNELMMLSNPSIEALVMSDLAETLALKLDDAIFDGTGNSNEPIGIKRTASIGSTTMNDSPDEDKLLDMLLTLEVANSTMTSVGWAMHPRLWDKIRRLRDGNGRRLIGPDNMDAGIPSRLLGYPVQTSTQITQVTNGAGDIFLCDYAQVLVGFWGGGYNFAVSTEADTAFAADQTWIRVTRLCDVLVREPNAICLDSTAQAV